MNIVIAGESDIYIKEIGAILKDNDFNVYHLVDVLKESYSLGPFDSSEDTLSDAIDSLYSSITILDAVIINPGLFSFYEHVDAVEDIDQSTWEKNIETRLINLHRNIKQFTKRMTRNRQGKIIILMSILGEIPRKGSLISSVMDNALKALLKSAAIELGRYNVSFFGIAIGPMNINRVTPSPYAFDINSIPMRRQVKISDIADVLLMLISGNVSLSTGSIIKTDGGITC
jgi:NAD(P)-dependent dehydrogenase (short-subunit alcohol dehydrogenase family)